MAGRHFLQIPGPTPVPDRLLRAMNRAMEDHRSSAFPALTRSILSRLPQVVHQTKGEPFVFPATGTAMWEAALVNTVNPGARLLAVRFGQFSHLFIQTARARLSGGRDRRAVGRCGRSGTHRSGAGGRHGA